VGEINPVEQHRQLSRIKLRTQRAVVDDRLSEAALLKTLVVEDEAPARPGENLRAVRLSREKDEEVAGVEVLLPAVADNGAQPVDAVAHVARLSRQENPD
jgi:hypothetical protein